MNAAAVSWTIPSDQEPQFTEQQNLLFPSSWPQWFNMDELLVWSPTAKKTKGIQEWEIKYVLSTVMINFMCELDCLDLGETLFQGVTIKVFLDEISI